MAHIRAKIETHLRVLRRSTFAMNTLYLILSTFAVAALGVLFWVIITHSHGVAEVGLATALLSVSGLLSLLGLAGFDTTFVRFLPGVARKNDYINSGFMIVTLVSGVLALSVGAFLPFLASEFSVLSSPGVLLAFVFFTVATTLNTLTNAVFLAYKRARYIFVINTTFSVVKVGLPLLFIRGGAITIFVIAGLAQVVGLVLSVVVMKRTFAYQFSPKIHGDVLRDVRTFSFSVYASSVLNLLPPTLLPLIIVFHLGATDAAYYYIAFTIAGALYAIAYASMQSVFAEGSHDDSQLAAHITKAAKIIATVLLPAAIVVALVSTFALDVFGDEYAAQAAPLLQLFAMSALPVAIYSALGAIFKITKNLHGVIAMNLAYAVVILSFSYIVVPYWGLIAVGWAWFAGNLAACGVGAFFLIKHNARSVRHGATT